MTPREDIDPDLTGNPDGVTAPEIPEAPTAPPTVQVAGPWCDNAWQLGWYAGYEAALLDRGRT